MVKIFRLIFITGLVVLLNGCVLVKSTPEINYNLFGTWTLTESRCDDMVVKLSSVQKIVIVKDTLIISAQQGECQFSHTMHYKVTGNKITAEGPGIISCSTNLCPAEVKMINQLGGIETMKLECPKFKKDKAVYFSFRLEDDKTSTGCGK